MLKRDPAMQKEYQEAIQKYEKVGTSDECPFNEITQRMVVPFIMYLIMSRSDQNEKQPSIG